MKRVLIVDDAAFMRLIIKKMLTKNGYEVAGEAGDVGEAVRGYERLRPDLVIMDISMPGRGDGEKKSDFSSHSKSGIDAITEIIKIDPGARIMVCSAVGNKDIVVEALKSGAKDYIVKPFEEKNLMAALKRLTG